MKKYFFFIAALLLFQGAGIVSSPAATEPSEAVAMLAARLEAWDVEDAWPVVVKMLAEQPRDAALLEKAADIAYYRGDYEEALTLVKRSLEVEGAGGEEKHRKGFALFIEETIQVMRSYKRYESAHFIITLDEKQDGILVDYLIDALEKTQSLMARQYGFIPREKVRVELFPDAGAFYRASTLSVRDIEVTGAVGLAKFNKLQFLSPRALVHGYRWLDAISHEYMHYLITKLSSNKAPIWFHEGLAKYEETNWRSGPGYLSPLNRTLLSQAVGNNKLIGFDKMEPSLLYLETPEEVQLAYAQSASAIEFIIKRKGYAGLTAIMSRMTKSAATGAGESIREVLGMEFSEFEGAWKEFLAGMALKPVAGTAVRRYKVKEGKADEDRMDLQEITSLIARNRAHLGDKLKEQGRLRAAVLEYRRALTETRDAIPVMNRLSAALIELGQDAEAMDVLNRTLSFDPNHPTPYVQLGQIYLRRKEFGEAKRSFEESIQINPFNPLAHTGLADASALLEDNIAAARERDIAKRVRR